MPFLLSKIVLLCSTILLLTCSSVVVGQAITLSLEATYKTGVFNKGAQEISVFSECTQNIYATNDNALTIDVLRFDATTNWRTGTSELTLVGRINLAPFNINLNSVDVSPGRVIAVAGTNSINSTAPGKVLFFDEWTLNFLGEVEVGALPDMVQFYKNKLIVCNEAEAANGIDPIGSISIIEWSIIYTGGPPIWNTVEKKILFSSLGQTPEQLRSAGVRIFPGKTVDEDFEPEYITIIGGKAYITLQEQNSIAIIDLTTDTLLSIMPLGYIAISDNGKSIDTSDVDKQYMPRNFSNIFGMFMPDTIKSFRGNDRHNYLVTANEGDARSESKRLSTLNLDPSTLGDVTTLKDTTIGAGRLDVSNIDGLSTTTPGLYSQLYAYGTRSFSVWNASTMELVFDSGNDFERITYDKYGPLYFNSGHDCDNCSDSRSDNKGPEPEALAVGTINGFTYAFIGLERMGGIMVYDITKPKKSKFVTYFNHRNFDVFVNSTDAGDLGPEGIEFIPAGVLSEYPHPMILVSNEVSGTTSLYKITVNRKRKIKRNKKLLCKVNNPYDL